MGSNKTLTKKRWVGVGKIGRRGEVYGIIGV